MVPKPWGRKAIKTSTTTGTGLTTSAATNIVTSAAATAMGELDTAATSKYKNLLVITSLRNNNR